MANRVSNEQLEALLEFLQEHSSLAKGIGLGARSKETVDRQWNNLAMKLNSIGSGSSKTGERWKKYWADIKHKSKTRLAKHRRESSGTGGGPSTEDNFTEIDKKILSIIGEQAVFGDVEHRVPIFNNMECTPINLPEDNDQSNNDISDILLYCEENQTKSAPHLQTVSPSTRGQTSNISISNLPEGAPSCSTMATQQIPRSTLHTALESPVSRPVRDRTKRPQYKLNKLNQPRMKTQSRIDPEWVKDLEKNRVEAELKLANAASIMAESSRKQAEAFANAMGVMAESSHILAEASANATSIMAKAMHMQAEASKMQAEGFKMVAHALLMSKDMLPPTS